MKESNKQRITLREQAAVRLFILSDGGIGAADLFRIAYDGSEADIAKLTAIPSRATRWFQSAKIQSYLSEQRAVYADRKEKERIAIEMQFRDQMKADAKDAKVKGEIDYSDPQNVLQKLNTIVNSSSDNGEILDAIRLLIQKQNDLAPARKTEQVQRFYTPVACRGCMIREAFHKLTTEHPEILKKQ